MTTETVPPATLRQHENFFWLRQERGISLEQIACSTKISVRYLRAIEEGQFEKLPGGIFNTSYIRQYARAIGHPETEILACCQSQAETGARYASSDESPKKRWASGGRAIKRLVRQILLLS